MESYCKIIEDGDEISLKEQNQKPKTEEIRYEIEKGELNIFTGQIVRSHTRSLSRTLLE